MSDEKTYAVLIDADNISPKYLGPIFDEMSNYGVVTYKRIYGDWTSVRNNAWKDSLLKMGVSPVQQYSYTTGKNATDSAMIIDAMDILYSKNVDGFCIVSSDSDFTRLALRLRESGMHVIGMGEEKTPKPFSVACNVFKYLDILSENTDDNEEESISEKTPIAVIEDAIIKLVAEYGDDDKGMSIGELGSRLVKRYPDFDVRNYGYTKLSKFLESLPSIKLSVKGKVINAHLKDFEGSIAKIEDYILSLIRQSPEKQMQLSEINLKLLEEFPGFNLRKYGYTRLYKFVNDMDKFYVKSTGKNGCVKIVVENKRIKALSKN